MAINISKASIKEIDKRLLELQKTVPRYGLFKIVPLLVGIILALNTAGLFHNQALFLIFVMIAGVFYASLMITTHDAIHHTLTGNKYFDEIFARVISYPIIWWHGTYGEVHKLHHKLNGESIDDPERVSPSDEEFEQANGWRKFYFQNQWLINIFIFAGIGLILKTLKHGSKHFANSKAMRRNLLIDTVGIMLVQFLLNYVAIVNGKPWRWVVIWFIWQWIIGAILQFRAHIEHYGLSAPGMTFHSQQIVSCRNIRTKNWVSYFFNRLNFHSVHHAFPRIPFYNLELAHALMMEHLSSDERLLVCEDEGYFRTAIRLAASPSGVRLRQTRY